MAGVPYNNRDSLVAPGSGGNRAGRAGLAEEMSRRGLAVLLMDYRGYGGNPGSLGRDGLDADRGRRRSSLDGPRVPTATECLLRRVLGFSRGGGAAGPAPAGGNRSALALHRAGRRGSHHYPWLPVRVMLRDRFRVMQHLATSDVPVPVIYGDHDSVVPTVLTARVANHAPSSAERLVIVGPTTTTPSCSAHECEGCDSPFQCPSLCCGLAAAWRPPIPPDLRKTRTWIDDANYTEHRTDPQMLPSLGRLAERVMLRRLMGLSLAGGGRLRGVSLVWASSRLPLPGVRGSPSSRDAGRRVGRCCRRAAR